MYYVQGTIGDKVIMITSLQWDQDHLHRGDDVCAEVSKSL